MLEKEMKKIVINDKEYNLKCTIGVVEKIQDKYGSYIEFENKLKNKVEVNGKELYEPNVEAIMFGLKEMIIAGAKASKEDIEIPEDFEEEAWKLGIYELAAVVLETFIDCFARKNVKATQKKTTKKTS